MNSYFIFAIALTVVYIIYYAVIVVQDLYGKKGTDKPGEEIFDLDMEDTTEESIDVSENDTVSVSAARNTIRKIFNLLPNHPKKPTPIKEREPHRSGSNN